MRANKFILLLIFGIISMIHLTQGRAVNISNTWTLPQEGFSVFYRFFRDKISWFEADAVCQFHHANLVTVGNGIEFDATRAFLKELDVSEPVWIGLMRPQNSPKFAWANSKTLDASSGYWAEAIPVIESPLCAVIDPLRDFRWHALRCGGPETAAFLCEMIVPEWATECTINAMPSLTVQYMSDSGTIQLSRDCGEEGTRHILCKGKEDHDLILKQLVCSDELPGNSDNNLIIETTSQDTITTAVVSQSKSESILIIPSDNNEDNHIEKNLNRIDVKEEKPIDKFNMDDMMLGDEPPKNDNEKLDKKISMKKTDLIEGGSKKRKINTNKSEKEILEQKEIMMGDQPIEEIQSDLEILPHEKKSLPQDLKPKPTTNSIDLTTEIEISSTQQQILSTTPQLITTTLDQRMRRRTETETSSQSSITTEDDENSTDNYTTTDLNQDSSNSDQSTPLISTTTTVFTFPTKPEVYEDGRFGGGHPIHIPKNILIQNDITTKSPTSKIPPIRPTQRRDLGEEHFIPPMLLVKSQFTSTKSHMDNIQTTVKPFINKSEEITEINDNQSTIPGDVIDLEKNDEIITTEIPKDKFLFTENCTATDENIPSTMSSSTIEQTNSIEQEIIKLENTTKVDDLNKTKETVIEGAKALPQVMLEKTEKETTVNTLETSSPLSTTITSSEITTKKVITSATESITTISPHNPSSTENEITTNFIENNTIRPTEIDLIQQKTELLEQEIIQQSQNSQETQKPITQITKVTTTSEPLTSLSSLSLSTTKTTAPATSQMHDDVSNLNLNLNLNNNDNDNNNNETDDSELNEHIDYENKFSNIENFQPYRPNRHRALTKPEPQSMIKKILG